MVKEEGEIRNGWGMGHHHFRDWLIAQARMMAGPSPSGGVSSSPTETVRREIALAVSHLEDLERSRSVLKGSLLRLELGIDTELIQMEQRTPRYSPLRFPEREKLQQRLHRVGEERRRLETRHDEQRRILELHLLTLVHQVAALQGDP